MRIAHSSMLCCRRSFMGSKKSSTSNAAVEILLKAPLIRIAARFWSFVSSLISFAIPTLAVIALPGSTRQKHPRAPAAQLQPGRVFA